LYLCRILGVHGGGYEEYHLLGYDCLPPDCLLVFAEIISLTLKMEAICSSETSVATQQTTRCHIPEDDLQTVFIPFGDEVIQDKFVETRFIPF
jgi:hypothetical protein